MLDEAKIDYIRHDNGFPWIKDLPAAQRLIEEQLTTDWSALLREIDRTLNPLHDRIFSAWPMDYYWSTYQTELATDVLFRDPTALDSVYPAFVRHAVQP